MGGRGGRLVGTELAAPRAGRLCHAGITRRQPRTWPPRSPIALRHPRLSLLRSPIVLRQPRLLLLRSPNVLPRRQICPGGSVPGSRGFVPASGGSVPGSPRLGTGLRRLCTGLPRALVPASRGSVPRSDRNFPPSAGVYPAPRARYHRGYACTARHLGVSDRDPQHVGHAPGLWTRVLSHPDAWSGASGAFVRSVRHVRTNGAKILSPRRSTVRHAACFGAPSWSLTSDASSGVDAPPRTSRTCPA
jgi:hypothetical protein